jgi:hypothetical protein
MNGRYLFPRYFTPTALQRRQNVTATSIVTISSMLLTVQLLGLHVCAIKLDRLIGWAHGWILRHFQKETFKFIFKSTTVLFYEPVKLL